MYVFTNSFSNGLQCESIACIIDVCQAGDSLKNFRNKELSKCIRVIIRAAGKISPGPPSYILIYFVIYSGSNGSSRD
jgi:hypothetical protein